MPMAVVATARCLNQVTLSKAMLPDDMRWNPGISRIGEVAVRGPANESAIARRVEPSDGLTIGDHRCRRRLHLILTTTTTATPAMPPMAAPIAMVLVVATLITTVELLPAAMMFIPVIRWRRGRGLRWTRVILTHDRWCGRAFCRGRVRRPFTVHRGSFGGSIVTRALNRLDSRRGFCRIAFVWVLVRTRLGALIFRLPSGARTAAPATGAATFSHVVEKVLVDVCSMRLVRRNSSGARMQRA